MVDSDNVAVPSVVAALDAVDAPDAEVPVDVQLSPPSLASLACSALQAASPKVAGNIHHLRYRSSWKSLKPDAYVMSILEPGYRIPFRDGVLPESYREPNNRSALDNMPYLQQHVETLVADETVNEVFVQPTCCSPLTVASRYVNGLNRLRMCIDLSRYINLFLKKESVTLPSLDKALNAWRPSSHV